MSKHLITSAIPYVNGVKHLGNLVGSMLPADVYARFLRAQGHEVMFICGTDDHGTPVEIASQKENTPTAAFVKKWHDFQENIYRGFGLSFDWFGSSSNPQNREMTQMFAKALQSNNLLDVRAERMLYSHVDKRFLPDRYVEGECPHCHYTKARGDQCENCGRVLDPTDLLHPRSAISGSTELEVRETRHLYFKQSNLVPELKKWIESQSNWPLLSRSIANKWLEEGLQDRGITRDIQWGVPVPPEVFGEEFKGKVFYVWFDAPIAYIAATKELTDSKGLPDSEWQKWWLNADDVTYTEFMGKDNVYFHTISFPATLIGASKPGHQWKLVDNLKSFSWLTYYGGKFSTSQGIGIFTDTALELLPADYWRYYLLARAPESDDSAFTWQDFQNTVNKDLADVLGNFINRTLQLTNKNFGAQIPAYSTPAEADTVLANRLNEILSRYTQHMEKVELRKSVEALRELWVAGNEYLAAQEPWQVIKTDKERAGSILNIACNLIPMYARAMAPIIPHSAAKIMALFPNPQTFIKTPIPAQTSCPRSDDGSVLEQNRGTHHASGAASNIHGTHTAWPWPTDLHTCAPSTSTFTLPESVLFPKITDEQREEWETRFGNQKA